MIDLHVCCLGDDCSCTFKHVVFWLGYFADISSYFTGFKVLNRLSCT